MAGKEKVTIMVLKVDLHCPKCYKKVKKVLCKFSQIRDQVYDEKANKVTIKVLCCSPEKIRDKLCCKGGRSIKSVEIKEPEKPKPLPPPTPPKKPEDKPPRGRPVKTKNVDGDVRDPPVGTTTDREKKKSLIYPPPASPVVGFYYGECYYGHGGIPPCCSCGLVQCNGYHGRPLYDGWSGGQFDYFSEQSQQSCSIM